MRVVKGYKQTEVGVIPEDWEYLTIRDLISKELIEKPKDGNHGNIHPTSGDFVENGIPFVMANAVQNGYLDLPKCSCITKIQADGLQKGFSIEGDVLLTHKATIGNTALVGKLDTNYIMLTPQVTYYRVKDKNSLSNKYLRHFFDSIGFQKVMAVKAGGGTRSYIGIVAQHELPFVLPPTKAEQEAIAEALSDADSLIESLQQLIAKKRQIKQGAMQELLQPKPEWEEKTLGSFTSCTAGGTPSTQLSDYWGGSIPWMNSGELNLKIVHDVTGRITELGLKNSSTKMIPSHCILIGLAGQGKTRGTVATNTIPLCTNQSIAAIYPNDQYCGDYLYYNLDSRYKELREQSTGDGGRGGLNLTIIKNLVIPFPSLKKQTRIATILSDMDSEITALETKLTKAQQIKQGMMSELLTGKTRLI